MQKCWNVVTEKLPEKSILYFAVKCLFIAILSVSHNTVFSEGVGGIEKNHILDYFYFFDCSLCDWHRKHWLKGFILFITRKYYLLW